MPPPDRRTVALAGVAALLGFGLYDWFFRPVGGGRDVIGYIVGRDFLAMWAAPRLALAHGAAILADMPAFAAALPGMSGVPGVSAVWSYPPTALLLFLPASLPSYWTALALWTAAGVGACLLAARGLGAGRRALPLLIASPALVLDAAAGQNGAFTGALLMGGFALLDRRPALAGLLFGLMSFKPQLCVALAVALAALGAWRAVVGACASAAALALASTLAFGLEAWRGYVTVAMPFSAAVLVQGHGGQKLLLVSVASALAQGGWPAGAVMAAQAVAACAALALMARALRREAEPLRRLALVAAATPLATPYAWTYDLVALGAATALLHATEPCAAMRRLWGLGYLAPALSMLFEIFGIAAAPVLLAVPFLGLCGTALAPSSTDVPAQGPRRSISGGISGASAGGIG